MLPGHTCLPRPQLSAGSEEKGRTAAQPPQAPSTGHAPVWASVCGQGWWGQGRAQPHGCTPSYSLGALHHIPFCCSSSGCSFENPQCQAPNQRAAPATLWQVELSFASEMGKDKNKRKQQQQMSSSSILLTSNKPKSPSKSKTKQNRGYGETLSVSAIASVAESSLQPRPFEAQVAQVLEARHHALLTPCTEVQCSCTDVLLHHESSSSEGMSRVLGQAASCTAAQRASHEDPVQASTPGASPVPTSRMDAPGAPTAVSGTSDEGPFPPGTAPRRHAGASQTDHRESQAQLK